MRNRTVYLWMLSFMFLISLYNFLSVALLKSEEYDFDEMVQQRRNEMINRNKSHPRFLSSNNDRSISVEISNDEGHEEFVPDYPTYEEPKIFWDNEVEASIPKVSNTIDLCEKFKEKINSLKIKHLELATFSKCGRPNNAYAELEDGTPICVRYRHPHDYLISGEVLSFHLASYLNINVPCVVLTSTGKNDQSKWPVDFGILKWDEDINVALIQWIPNLSLDLKLPKTFQNSLDSGTPMRYYDVHGKPLKLRATLAQWSNLFLFDYIIGHHDRFARLQDDADKENRTAILKNIIPNLGLDRNGLMWIFDNEPGLLDAYELMYEKQNFGSLNADSLRFRKFHNQTLKSICIFRKKVLLSIIRLYQREDPVDYLLHFSETAEPNLNTLNLDMDYRYQKYFRSNFRQRLADVIGHAKWCADTQDGNT